MKTLIAQIVLDTNHDVPNCSKCARIKPDKQLELLWVVTKFILIRKSDFKCSPMTISQTTGD